MISLALESIICVIAIYSLRLADVKCLGLNSTQAGGYEVGELDGENLQSPVIHHPFNSWIRQSEIDVWFVIRLSVRFSSRNSQLSRALVVRSPQPQSLSRNLWTHQPSQIDLSCSRNNETFCDVRVCCIKIFSLFIIYVLFEFWCWRLKRVGATRMGRKNRAFTNWFATDLTDKQQ